MTEAELQACVIDLAHALNWRVAHFRPALTSKGWRTPVGGDGAGFPDLVLAKMGRILFAELKGDHGKLSKAQLDWMGQLDEHLEVWRPAQWHDGTILAALSGTS